MLFVKSFDIFLYIFYGYQSVQCLTSSWVNFGKIIFLRIYLFHLGFKNVFACRYTQSIMIFKCLLYQQLLSPCHFLFVYFSFLIFSLIQVVRGLSIFWYLQRARISIYQFDQFLFLSLIFLSQHSLSFGLFFQLCELGI